MEFSACLGKAGSSRLLVGGQHHAGEARELELGHRQEGRTALLSPPQVSMTSSMERGSVLTRLDRQPSALPALGDQGSSAASGAHSRPQAPPHSLRTLSLQGQAL